MAILQVHQAKALKQVHEGSTDPGLIQELRTTTDFALRHPPRPSQAPSCPGSRRSGPDTGNPEILKFALSEEMAGTAPLLPQEEGREENLFFFFFFFFFFTSGGPLEQVSRHTVVTTDASSTGWGATCNEQAASGLLLSYSYGAPTALAHQLHRAVDSASSLLAVPATAVGKAHASPHGQHCGCLVHQTVGRYTITPHVTARPPSPSLESHAVQVTAQSCGRRAQVDLFASHESSHCQLYFSLTEGPLGTDALAHSWPQALCKYAFPPVSLLAQALCKLRVLLVLLVGPHWPSRTWFPELISLDTAPPWRIPLRKDLLSQGLGTIWHPRSDLWNLHVWILDGTRNTRSRGGGSVSSVLHTYPGLVSISPGCFHCCFPFPQLGLLPKQLVDMSLHGLQLQPHRMQLECVLTCTQR